MIAVSAVVAAAMAALGYLIGRARAGRRLLEWAEERDRGPHGPAWWAAQAIGVAAVVWMLIAHPRQAAANRRSWRGAHAQQKSPATGVPRHASAPQLDPDWAANRRAATTPKEDRTP